MFGAAVGTGEEMILAPERDGTDGALDSIGVDLDAAIIEETGEPVPARECISDCFCDRRFSRDGCKLRFEPRSQPIDERLAAREPHALTLLGRAAADVGLDRIESTDTHERLRCDRRRGRRMDLIEAPPHMAPAKGEDDIAALGEAGIGAIAVDLQDAP